MTKPLVLALLPLLAALAAPARAGLLPEAADWREIGFESVDNRPVIAARAGGTAGRFMFDTGSDEALFLNRDAVPLGEGSFVARGKAASGQAIEVRLHDAPTVEVDGLPFATGAKCASGDLGFVEAGFGEDFLGFIGTPAVLEGAFVLDYDRKVLTVLRVGAGGVLAVPAPDASDIAARLTVEMAEDGLPVSGAYIGDLSLAVDFDTGDSGTIYLRPETLAGLRATGGITVEGDRAVLGGLRLGGATFDGVTVQIVEAGGPADVRRWPGSDSLRIGAAFFASHPTLWNFPAGTLTILKPGAGFLGPR